MNISVAICTWNRANMLDQTLQQMQKLNVASGLEWEILVVNNNCTDNTDDIIDKHKTKLPIRRIIETKKGISNARNAALEVTNSEWLLFTDDDVLVSPDWLSSYSEAIRTCSANIAFMGGDIVPWFPHTPDPDLVAAIPTVGNGFCGRTVSEKRLIELGEKLPLGANFAVKCNLLEGLKFNPNLGLVENQRTVGEEITLMQELLNLGFLGLWVENAIVKHYVDPKRLTLRSMCQHLFDLGRSEVRMKRLNSADQKHSLPLWTYRQLIESGVMMFVFFIIRRRIAYLQNFKQFFINAGEIKEHFHRAEQRNHP
ncbi:glycosyltransferase family 2 protein [bacterium]|jgi:glucosyl-dolichyl phosphate glucuronosyltransferase|nr:glycosyltransferase family 2 protein [bacterium]